MQTTPYIWIDGKVVKWNDAKVHILTHSLHYGAAVFEGIRVYETDKGPAVFRLQDHIKRLYHSAQAISMKVPYTQKQIIDETLKLLKKNKMKSGYIRHLIYYGYGKMGVNPTSAPVNFSISMWGWGKYLSEDPIRVKTSSFKRIHPETTITTAKIMGHYHNSILATLEATKAGFHEALFMDHKGHIVEGAAENIFIVKKNVLYTPPVHAGILPGFTRESVMQIAKDLGYKVVEKNLKPADIYKSDECFFTGTAAEVTPICQADKHKIGNGKYPIAMFLKEKYEDVVMGKNPKYKKWLTVVK